MADIYYFLYIGYLLLTVMLIMFSKKKSSLRFSWVLMVLLVPVVGLILYFIMGSSSVLNLRKARIRQKHGSTLKALEDQAGCSSPGGDSFLYNYCGSPLTTDNDVTLFIDATSKYQSLFSQLRQANDSIHLQYFSIAGGEVWQELKGILLERARSGVEVKFMYDSIGCLFSFGQLQIRQLRAEGVQVAAIRPNTLEINHRNHRKIVVIDGQIAYTGGMNIGDVYRDGVGDKPWRDTHLRIVGSAVHQFQRIFLIDWLISAREVGLRKELSHYFPAPPGRDGLAMQIVANDLHDKFADNDVINFSYFHLISRARKRVWIQTPYFAPTDIILESLIGLARAGIDVRIMTSSSFASGGLFHATITNYFLRYLADSGVKVYKYKGILHAKTMVVDDSTACIGSVNLNSRSLRKDDEVYAHFTCQDFVHQCQAIFKQDLRHCVELDYSEFQRQSLSSRALESAMSLFSSFC